MCLDVLNAALWNSASLGVLSRCPIQLLFSSVCFPVQGNAKRLSDSQRILLISRATPPNFLNKPIDLDMDKDVVYELSKVFKNCSILWCSMAKNVFALPFCTCTLPLVNCISKNRTGSTWYIKKSSRVKVISLFLNSSSVRRTHAWKKTTALSSKTRFANTFSSTISSGMITLESLYPSGASILSIIESLPRPELLRLLPRPLLRFCDPFVLPSSFSGMSTMENTYEGATGRFVDNISSGQQLGRTGSSVWGLGRISSKSPISSHCEFLYVTSQSTPIVLCEKAGFEHTWIRRELQLGLSIIWSICNSERTATFSYPTLQKWAQKSN